MSTVASNTLQRKSCRVAGARQTPMPGFIEPWDPTLQEYAPVGHNWIYEIKGRWLPGAGAHPQRTCDGLFPQRLRLDGQFASIAKAAARLKVRDAIIDGE